MACRVKLGGIGNNTTEADVKKNNYPVFKAAKLPSVKTAALQDISIPAKAGEGDSSPKKQLNRSSVSFKGIKPPSSAQKVVSKTGIAADKKKSITNPADLKDAVSHEEDPIAASLRARIAAGGLSS